MSTVAGLTTTVRTARANATWPLLAGGSMQVYSGARPTTPGDAATGCTLLSTFTLPDPVGAVANGIFTGAVGSIPAALVLADGNAAWCRGLTSEGEVIADFDAGLVNSDAAVQFDNLQLVTGGYLSLVSLIITEG